MAYHIENRSLFDVIAKGGRDPSASPEALGDRLRIEIVAMWRVLISLDAKQWHKTTLQDRLRRWLPLLERPPFRTQLDTLPLLVRLLDELPKEAAALTKPILSTLLTCAAGSTPHRETRLRLARAARREEVLGWNTIFELALLGLPESLPELERLCPKTVLRDLETAERHLRSLLGFGGKSDAPSRRAALFAFFLGPGLEFAEPLLASLNRAETAPEVWEGVAHAALRRPRLQAPFVRALAEQPRPALRPVLAHIASWGSPSIEPEARALLATFGSTTGHPPGLPNPLPQPLPWSADGRAAVASLLDAGPRTRPPPNAIHALNALVADADPASVDLLEEVLERLSARLGEKAIQALFVEVVTATASRALLVSAAAHLMRRRVDGEKLPTDLRRRLARRAPRIVDGAETRLTLYRLALPEPDAIEGWKAARRAVLRHTDLAELDLSLALDLVPTHPEILQGLLADSTPNQRRLLVSRAPLDRHAEAIGAFASALGALDPSALPLLCGRLAELAAPAPQDLATSSPEPRALTSPRALESLWELAAPGRHLATRQAAVDAIARIGGPAELPLLARLPGLDTQAARRTLVARLREAGLPLEPQSLALVTSEGQLALSDGTGTSSDLPHPPPSPLPPPPSPSPPPPRAPTPARDPRQGLLPPPRRVGPLVWLVHLLFAANGWNAIWSTGLGILIPAALVVGPNFFLWLAALGFVLTHIAANTPRVLGALARGTLLVATTRLSTTRRFGKNTSVTYHHTFTLLGDSGETHEHTVSASQRLDKLLDEPLEPVLARLGPGGAPRVVIPIDSLVLVNVTARGHWRLSTTAWVLLLVSSGLVSAILVAAS